MTATAPAPPRREPTSEAPDRRPDPPGGARSDALLPPLIALVVTACLPLTRVFIGLDFLRPVLAAALLSLGVSWVARRLGGGPILALLASALAWAVFVGLAFMPGTLAYGVVPTFDMIDAARILWLQGIELIRTTPAPAIPDAGILFLTATGVWWAVHAIDSLLFRLQAPLRAIAMALVLWVVPLALNRYGGAVLTWSAPILAASGWLLLVAGGGDAHRWGVPVRGGARARRTAPGQLGSGAFITGAAIVAGALLAGFLPGFGEPPYYRVQGLGGGPTLTTNPIVTIRDSLVQPGTDPVARVETPRPVYLRLTSLDRYDEQEQWRSDGIRGGPARGPLPFETELPDYEPLEVDVTPQGLDRAILVPAPYQPERVEGPAADRLHYDPSNATLTLGAGSGLAPEEHYRVAAAIPAPDPEALRSASVDGADPALTELPRGVPEEVAALAAGIVERAGADTAFDRALAIQEELRTWTYSLDPPPGHSGSAMLDFIEQRVGYCEQYAGTMAVMLRTLDIPARVAVGYTPGELVEEGEERDTYLVTRANAHAWVEVLFPGLGWIAFEPTPRSDGNVLAPSASNLAPAQLVADEDRDAQDGDLGDLAGEDGLGSDLEDMPLEGEIPPEGAGGAGGGGDDGGPSAGWVAALLALGGAAGAAAGLHRRRRRVQGARTTPERVLAAAGRVRRTGRGLARPPRPTETDREYLLRLTGDASADARGAAELLATAAGRARYAPAVDEEDAPRAEAAADQLIGVLLDALPGWRRRLVPVRGAVSAAFAAVARWRGAREPALELRP